ncbi:MAG: M48 family metallopeptidase [Cyanobacteria bacterium P01_H01_bin.58]
MRALWTQQLRNIGRRCLYGAIALVVASSVVMATPEPSKASLLDLLFNGIQYVQLSNLNDDQEVQLGKQTDQALRRQGVPIYTRNPEIVNYVNNIGQRLAKQSARPNIPYTFQVVDDNSVNAFATSGGFVYIHTGLIREADTEAELAGVVAHEIGHIAGRHAINRMREITLANGIAGALGVSEDDLVNIGVQLALFLPNSRSAENEADALGYENMGRAGYDQRGSITFMQKLAEGDAPPEIFSTHPDPDNRVNRLQSMYQSSHQADAKDGSNPQAYQSRISGL